jgi:dUTP pyrophosphatase
MNYVENVLVFWALAFFFIVVIHIVHTIYKNKTKIVDTSSEVFKFMHDAMIKNKKDNLKPLRSETNYLDELHNQTKELVKALEDGVPHNPNFNDMNNRTKGLLSQLRDNAANSMLTNAGLPPTFLGDILTGPMEVKIKKLHKDAVIPMRPDDSNAGFDLVAISKEFEVNEAGQKLLVYDTGLAFELPLNHVGLLFPRSSIAKTGLILSNSVGVLDQNYRGSVKFKFRIDGRPTKKSSYNVGDRIGQIVIIPYPSIKFVESDELSSTERGAGGYGSSGK